MAEVKLEPCPFCGGEAAFMTQEVAYQDMHYVACTNSACLMYQVSTALREEKLYAANDWNTRTPTTGFNAGLESATHEGLAVLHCEKHQPWADIAVKQAATDRASPLPTPSQETKK